MLRCSTRGRPVHLSATHWLTDRVLIGVERDGERRRRLVLKFGASAADETPWRESALQRHLHTKTPAHIVPMAYASDRVEARVGNRRDWWPVKATVFAGDVDVSFDVSTVADTTPASTPVCTGGDGARRRRSTRSTTSAALAKTRVVDAAVVAHIGRSLRETPLATNKRDADWASAKNIVWQRVVIIGADDGDACSAHVTARALYHDFDKNV